MDRLLSEEELAQAGASVADPWLELAAEANGIGFFNWDVIDDHLRWNRGAEERMGLTAGTISSFAQWRSLIHPDDAQRVEDDITRLSATQAPRLAYRYRFTPPDGHLRIMEGAAQCLYDQDGTLRRLMGVNMDVTRREEDRLALAGSEAQMRTIVETVPDAMVTIRADGRICRFNKAAEQLFGWCEAEVIGADIARLLPDYDTGLVADLIGGRHRATARTQQLTAVRADGRVFPIELKVGDATFGDEQLSIAFIRDISERIEAAQKFEDLRGEFLRGARLTAMGEVAAGLAHELNQPLSAAANYLAAVEMSIEDVAASRPIIENVRSAGAQIARTGDIIRRLRGFLSIDDRTPQDIAMREIIDEALLLALAGRDRNRVPVSVSLRPAAMTVFADRVQIQQVLVNLIRNAVEAMDDGATETKRIMIDGVRRNGVATFHVDDVGPGFPERVLRESHVPFISTKGAAGMGLGLAICRRIIEAQHGKLSLANRTNGGARVEFTLPAGAA